MAAMSDYLENKIIDWLFRGVSYTPPANMYIGLVTALATDSTGGTEVSGGSYARQAVAQSTSNWAATNGATTTTNPSSGTSGTTSNNAVITYPAPTGNWGVVVGMVAFDALSSGNALFYSPLTVSKTINNGDAAPTFPISALTFQIDN